MPVPPNRKTSKTDVFAGLRTLRRKKRLRVYDGPDLELVAHWLTATDLPFVVQLAKLKSFSAELHRYTQLHPTADLGSIITSLDFKIYQLQHSIDEDAPKIPSDPFGEIKH